MNPIPTDLQLDSEGRLVIQWNDCVQHAYLARQLRDACPCATCREKQTSSNQLSGDQLPILAPEETLPLRITAMNPVGNYAYGIQFSDGHNTGIYTLEFLRQIGAFLAGDSPGGQREK